MIGKILCAGVLAAVLMLLPNPNSGEHVKNSETQAAVAKTAGQMRQQDLLTAEASTQRQMREPAPVMEKPVSEPESTARQEKLAVPSEPITENERLMQAAEIPKEDWNATSYIVSKESSWCYKRMNGDHRPCDAITQPTREEIGNKAYGLCQAYPVTKMASEGADYLTNPLTQLRWCHKYAQERYKGWSFAYAFWRANRWW